MTTLIDRVRGAHTSELRTLFKKNPPKFLLKIVKLSTEVTLLWRENLDIFEMAVVLKPSTLLLQVTSIIQNIDSFQNLSECFRSDHNRTLCGELI